MTEGITSADPLSDEIELLYRQVHPNFVTDAEPSSQAFKPTKKDFGRLSVARGSLTTAAEAFDLYTGPGGHASAGTWAVTVGEVREGSVTLSAFGDPKLEPVPDPAHAFIDFSERSRREIETKAKLLLAAARARGRLHPIQPAYP